MLRLSCGLIVTLGFLLPGRLAASVEYDAEHPQLAFAAQELEYALKETRREDLQVALIVRLDDSSPEAFQIRSVTPTQVEVTGSDATGAMYGGLEVAELLRLRLPIDDQDQEPFVEKRGIKFNIPWDARSPSYDDTGDSAQKNIETMYDFEFWRAYLDDLARYRYNMLSLWSTHPYANLVKLEDYPEAILEDIYRMKDGLIQPHHPRDLFKSFDTDGDGAITPEDGTIELVKKMTMDEKIAHWKRVFQYAEDRGVEIYLFSWNVFTHGATGKYGITQDQTNPTTIDYVRKSVREALLMYPQISGIGVCSGENDRRELDGTSDSTEHYIFKTYGRAIMDVKKGQPNREIRFIHRRHGSEPYWVRDAFKDYTGGPLYSSVKYAVAHIYSSRRPQEWERRIIEDGWIQDFKVYLNLRNDDIFMHRWGSPDFVREFIRWMPHEDSPGFYMGSDGYVWARDCISKNPAIAGQLEIVKHWYRFRLWGQLAYNNQLGDDYWQAVLKHRFPSADAKLLHDTWQTVSEITPQLNRSVWTATDAGFAAEGCMALFSHLGFLTVDDYHFDREPMPLSRIENAPDPQCISVAKWAQAYLAGDAKTLKGLTPLQVADNLDGFAQAADDALPRLRSQVGDNEELLETLLDIESMAHLGRYYADKMRGAAKLALFRVGDRQDSKVHSEAVAHLEGAVLHWKAYADVLGSHYHPSLMARTHHMDWNKTFEFVKDEVVTVRQEGDFPEVRFTNLQGGDSFPVGTDLRVDVTASDGDGIDEVKLYVNGLLLQAEDSTGPYVWSASSDEQLKNLREKFYRVEAVAIDKNGVVSRKVATIEVGNPKPGSENDWKDEIHRVFLSDGEILKSDKGDEVTFDLPRLECWFRFGGDGKMILRDEAADVIIWRANSKTEAGRHHAEFKNGKLTTYTDWPGGSDVNEIWTSVRNMKIRHKGPFKFGVTRGKKVVCFSEEDGETEIVWGYKPLYD
jgi:hypothetical protein